MTSSQRERGAGAGGRSNWTTSRCRVSFPDLPHCAASVANIGRQFRYYGTAMTTLTSSCRPRAPSSFAFAKPAAKLTFSLKTDPHTVLLQDRVARPHIPERGRRAPWSANDTDRWDDATPRYPRRKIHAFTSRSSESLTPRVPLNLHSSKRFSCPSETKKIYSIYPVLQSVFFLTSIP